MIERTLAALETAGPNEVMVGLDPDGSVAWRATANDVLGRIGGWQVRLRASGVRAGDRVALVLPRGPDLLPAHLAILASGACAVPVNPTLAEAERERVFTRAELACTLTESERPDGPAQPSLADVDEARPALLIFTSGTTGEPKGVPHSLASLEANLSGLAETWGLSADDRLLHALPAHHVHGLVLGLYGSARLALPVVLTPRFEAERCLASLDAQCISVFMGVPTMYHRMAGAQTRPELRHMRVFISGSAPLSTRDFARFSRRFGHEPLERYGLTETLIVSSNPLAGERRPGTVGLPLPRTELRLADDGEIEVRGPGVMPGYWRDEAVSDEAFDGAFFRTGDLGRRDERGYLVIAGRKKELIIVGGSNVLPGEVEQALCDEPGVDELAAAGLADEDRGEIVGAFVVAREGVEPHGLERRLRARADESLAPYKRPHIYRFLDALPRNAMGKVDRRRLR